ncbi:MAG: hypothetical protein GX324_03910 [Aeromonadales bacterium]|nr:hypothetical protein [Aeromonadales bacterium]
MAIPVILPTIAPNAASPTTEAAAADKARRPVIPAILSVQPYPAIRQRHKDRERSRRQEALAAWLGERQGALCLIGANPSMSRRLQVIRQRYQEADDDPGVALSVEV